jgi:putative glycosyltransferase (TIGR04372 family)
MRRIGVEHPLGLLADCHQRKMIEVTLEHSSGAGTRLKSTMIVRKFTLQRDDAPDRPFRIVAALLHRTLGDFVDQLLFAASVKELFPNARLYVTYRPDRPYKADLVKLAPQVDGAWPMPNGLSTDFFDTAGNPPVIPPEDWYDNLCHYPDLVLTPSMCRFEKLSSFDRLARFSLPNAEHWRRELAAKVGPDWFIVVHYREPTYALRSSEPMRDFNIQDATPVYDAILEAGGQVVRVGHPGMSALPERDGLIDLSADGLMLQAAAISHARFFLELSPSGPANLALPFACPLLRCNQSSIGRTYSDQGVTMPQRVLDGDGRDVTLEVLQKGLFNRSGIASLTGHRLIPNSPSQLVEGATMMLKHTANKGWRSPESQHDGPWPAEITLPFHNRLDMRILV